MALDLDTRQALRRPSDLAALVEAIRKANPEDEPDWLEWKSNLDLSRPDGRFQLARAVLGLSNRLPDRASNHCAGVGYVVVGAEPSNVCGTTRLDPAVVDDALSPYLGGSKGPAWGPIFVTSGGRDVLVVIVEPPRYGDPIYTLRKSFNEAQKGTVFVRRPGKTARADDADLDALQRRLTAPGQHAALELLVAVVGDVPLHWFLPTDRDDHITKWVARQRAELIRQAEEVERGRPQPRTLDLDASRAERAVSALAQIESQKAMLENIAQSIGALGFAQRDERTLEEYTASVDAWAEALGENAWALIAHRFFEGRNVIRLRVENPTERNLGSVQLRAHFPHEGAFADQARPEYDPPPRPRPFGKPKQMPRFDIPALSHQPFASPRVADVVLPPRLRLESGSIRMTWDVGDLRPQHADESDDIYIMLAEYPDGGSLRGTWTATAKSVDGVASGELLVPVHEQPLSPASLLDG